ncbi:hypothetical protein [Erysipelothrix urinaevulpis]|nr:hypothetical protein [Erysipelothrix urinaevulpis]
MVTLFSRHSQLNIESYLHFLSTCNEFILGRLTFKRLDMIAYV